MNKKGQSDLGIGGFVMLFIVLLVGLILLQGSAQNLSGVVNTVTVANTTINIPANGGVYEVTGYKSLSSVVAYNGSALVPSTNYTVNNNQVVNGNLVATIVPNATADLDAPYDWNVSFVGEPVTYGSASARSVTNMIIIFFALALAAVAIGYAVKNYNQ
jgi:hypothetical protein